jgi:hypothetical protein
MCKNHDHQLWLRIHPATIGYLMYGLQWRDRNMPGIFHDAITIKTNIFCSLLMVAMTSPGCSSTQTPEESMRYRLARTVGLSVIHDITDPERNKDFRVGLVNTVLQTGMLFGSQEPSGTLKYLRSTEAFFWADAAQKIAAPNNETFDFEYQETRLTDKNCPGLERILENFYTNLEATYPSSLQESEESMVPSGGPEEIMVDGTRYVIQMTVNETKITLTPDNGRTSALHAAAAKLEATAQNCASSIEGTIEHFFY